jgi:hypothetical protein
MSKVNILIEIISKQFAKGEIRMTTEHVFDNLICNQKSEN